MNAYARPSAVLLALLVATSGSPSEHVAAQEVVGTPTFLAIPQSFPDIEARAVLLREPGRDIVILDRDDAEPETLHVALSVLDRMRREHPLPADRGQVVPITGFAFLRQLDSQERLALQAVLTELRERPLASVGNLGTGRWMQYGSR